jgi:hypothetical protein
LRDFDFYEFAGVLVPGIALLVGLGFLFEAELPSSFLLPTDIGGALAPLAVAYALGHLIAGIGNALEVAYWWRWGGMPTDWPYSRWEREGSDDYRSRLVVHLGTDAGVESLEVWRDLVRRARASLYSEGKAGRLQVFSGTYGMSRGLAVVSLALLCVAWASELRASVVYPALAASGLIALLRMHRFGEYYATEFFANISALRKVGAENGD